MRRNPMTRPQHEALGAELHVIRERLVHLSVDLGNRYGSTSRIDRLVERARQAVDRLRCELDDQLARDLPDEFDPAVYYPGTRLDAAAQPTEVAGGER